MMAEARGIASRIVGYEIISLIKYEQEDTATYVMKFYDEDIARTVRELKMKSVDQLTEKFLFERTFFLAFNHKPPEITKVKWKEFVQTLHLFMVTERVSDESSTKGRMSSWVRTYLEDFAKIPIEQAIGNKDPFVHHKNGDWYLFSMPFRRWAFHVCGNIDGVGKVHLDFKLCGMMEETVNYVKLNSKTKSSTRAWRVPRAICDPSAPAHKEPASESKVICLVPDHVDNLTCALPESKQA